jgi:hypothetical protein
MGIMPSRAVARCEGKTFSPRKTVTRHRVAAILSRELRHFRNDLVYTAGARRF